MILFISPKGKFATDRMLEESEKAGVSITHYDVEELAQQNFHIDVEKFSVLYVRQAYPYFNEVIALAGRCKKLGIYIVDEQFILSGFETSKKTMHEQLANAGVGIPADASFSVFPFVLKWIYGFGSTDVFLIQSHQDLERVWNRHPADEWIAQEYVVAEKEYEVYVVGFRSVPVILQYDTHNRFKVDTKTAKRIESTTENVLYENIKRLAEKAAVATGKELCKIDILESQGRLFVLEVNRSPGLVSFEKFLRYTIAKEFILYVNEKGKNMKKIMEKPATDTPVVPVDPTAPVVPAEPSGTAM